MNATLGAQHDAPEEHTRPHLGRFPIVLPRLTDPRLHVGVVTTTLQVLGQTVFKFDISIAQILITFGICMSMDVTSIFRRERTISWPSSSMPTASGIALIMRVPGTEHGDWWSTRGWWVFAGTAVFAMSSKYLIRVSGRHIFNPSNFALVVAFLVLGELRADPQVLWWGPITPALVLAFAVILAGSVLITRRVGQGPTAVTFWVTFAVAMAIVALSGHTITANWHVGPIGGFDYWLLLITSPEILVFTFFMITDPKTTPRSHVGRAVFGASIALVAGLILSVQPREHGTKVGLLASLVILCLFTRLIEQATPAAGSAGDTLQAWVRSIVSPPTRPGIRWPAVLGSVSLAALLFGTMFVLGGRDNSEPALEALTRRAEVAVPDPIPPVEVDATLDDGPGPAISLDSAKSMARDLVHGLAIERHAVERSDADLAASALAGVRLEQARERIASGAGPDIYSIDSLTATFVRVEPGPQAPPELALKATGEVTRAGGTEPLDATFVLTQVDGTYLLVNELDASGNAVGPQITSADKPLIESAYEPERGAVDGRRIAGISFADVSAAWGLPASDRRSAAIEGPAALTGDASVADFDGDGDMDLFVTRVRAPNTLYRNDGDRFVDVTEQSGLPLDFGQSSTTSIWADFDGDGNNDLAVVGFGPTPLHLYLAGEDHRFTDATNDWRLPSNERRDPDSAPVGVDAADYDNDGRVDLLVTEFDPFPVRSASLAADGRGGRPCGADLAKVIADRPAVPTGTVLLRNTPEGFVDRTEDLGIAPSRVLAMDPKFVDLDSDGWQDILIAGQGCTSKVLINDRTGRFVDRTEGSGAENIESAMASTLFDANGDGHLDWFVSGVSYPTRSGQCPLSEPLVGCSGNRLLLSDGDGTFTDATDDHGVRDAGWGWGSAAADIDGDGAIDLVQTAGYVTATTASRHPTERPFWGRSAVHTRRIWLGQPDGEWPEVSADIGLGELGQARSVLPIDVDSNGLVDLVFVDPGGMPSLWLNQSASETTRD